MHAIGVSGLSFSETLRTLASSSDTYRFSKAVAIEIMKAFVLNVDNFGVVRDSAGNPISKIINNDGTINTGAMSSTKNMFKWWQNYASSNQDHIGTMFNKMYAQLQFDSPIC